METKKAFGYAGALMIPDKQKAREFGIVKYDHGDKFETFTDIAKAKQRYESCGEFFPAEFFHVVEVSALREAEADATEHLRMYNLMASEYGAKNQQLKETQAKLEVAEREREREELKKILDAKIEMLLAQADEIEQLETELDFVKNSHDLYATNVALKVQKELAAANAEISAKDAEIERLTNILSETSV